MQQNNITARVIKVITERLDLDPDEIKTDDFIKDDLGADSLDLIEIIMLIEKEFLITIPDEDCEGDKTVQEVITLVEERCSGKV